MVGWKVPQCFECVSIGPIRCACQRDIFPTPPPTPHFALSDGSSTFTVNYHHAVQIVVSWNASALLPSPLNKPIDTHGDTLWRRALSATKQVVCEEGRGGDNDRRGGVAAGDQAPPGEGHRDRSSGKLDDLTELCLFF